ncbi:hypothetical protein O3M35_001487 [Rhynocoris fuscipes]|uniref:Uncharacterized protein n=1 Tax=Rhynocoris fuscipes TaxID=488301 RepID=A0AAW1CP54_9HEMI
MLLDGGCLGTRRSGRKKSLSVCNPTWSLSRPAIIYVQPRERYSKLKSHNSVTISPDFSAFGGSTRKQCSSSERLSTTPSSPGSPPLPPRVPKYVNYEEVLKQIEEDRPLEIQSKTSQEFLSEQSVDTESTKSNDFIDIPLVIEDSSSPDQVKYGDESKILSQFFDRLLENIYPPHSCRCGNCKHCETLIRRRSDSKLYEINKYVKEPLVRHHSYCLGLEEFNHCNRECEVMEVEGIRRSNPFQKEKVEASYLLVPYKPEELTNKELRELKSIFYALSRDIDEVANELRTQLKLKEMHLCEQDDFSDELTDILKLIAEKHSKYIIFFLLLLLPCYKWKLCM